MGNFTRKGIANRETVGELLATERERLGLSLAEVASRSRVQVRYLSALERGAYRELPGEVYARCFLRAYAVQLGLDTEQLVGRYRSESCIYRQTHTSETAHHKPVEKIRFGSLLAAPQLVRGALVGGLALVCIFYLGVKVQAIVRPPDLEVLSPSADLVTVEKTIAIAGQTETEVTVAVNGEPVVSDVDGNFNELVELQPGENTIEITAKKKHSQPTTVFRKVVVVEPEDNS